MKGGAMAVKKAIKRAAKKGVKKGMFISVAFAVWL